MTHVSAARRNGNINDALNRAKAGKETNDRQFRLMIPTTRPVGCLLEAACFAASASSTFRSAKVSSSSPSSSESSASSFLRVANEVLAACRRR